MKVVIAGGTGFLGSILCKHFQSTAEEVVLLVRRPAMDRREVQVLWDGLTIGDWTKSLDGADVLINLCGRSVNCRYNKKNKEAIFASRLLPTKALGEAISHLEIPPKVWLNASSATIYRHSEDRDMDEATGEIGSGFSVDVCQKWEQELALAQTPKTRKVALRTAMVMGTGAGGPFQAFADLVRKGLGGSMAGGMQWMSWIHERDFERAVSFLIENEGLAGPVNLASPCPLPNDEFMRELRTALGKKSGFNSPRWALKIGATLLGTEIELLVKSRRAVPGKLKAAGFEFEYPTWAEAARELAGRS